MEYKCSYTSPLGELLLVANDEFLTGILIKGSKFFPQSRDMELSESEPEIIQRTKMWLDIYFDGKEPDFTIPIKMEGTAFQKEVWEILFDNPLWKSHKLWRDSFFDCKAAWDKQNVRPGSRGCGRQKQDIDTYSLPQGNR